MLTPTRIFYVVCAAIGGTAAGGYVAWAIASRFIFIAGLNDRAEPEAHVLVVLCAAGGMLAFPLGAAAGLFVAVVANRVVEYVRRARSGGESAGASWVTRRERDDG